jgi:predicted dehydrogenase
MADVQAVYGVLIVGCGNIAGGFDQSRPPDAAPLTHAGAFARHQGFRIEACIDPDQGRRGDFAAHWRVPRAAASFADLAARPGAFDVISICSPTALHHEHLEAALRLEPRLIFCDKPLTSSAAESERLTQACRARGVALVVNYSRRWDPAVDALADELRRGRWGAVRSVVGHYNKGILNNGGHMVDLLLRLVGPMELAATAGLRHDFWHDDPTVAALLLTRNGGAPVYLNPADARDYAFFELELVCENGVVRMESGGMGWRIREAMASGQFKGYKTLGQAVEREGLYPQAMSRAVSDIHSHLAEGRAIISSGEEALEVQRLCEGILEAAMSSHASTV